MLNLAEIIHSLVSFNNVFFSAKKTKKKRWKKGRKKKKQQQIMCEFKKLASVVYLSVVLLLMKFCCRVVKVLRIHECSKWIPKRDYVRIKIGHFRVSHSLSFQSEIFFMIISSNINMNEN